MLLKNYYYYFVDVLPHEICDHIIKLAGQRQEIIGSTGNMDVDELQKDVNLQKQNEQHRSSYISWLDEPWIYREIHPFIHHANAQAGWNFEWNHTETAQFTRYKLNQYYHWHADQDANAYPQEHALGGMIRKLSCTVQLSHPHEYEGGDLQFDTPNGEFTAHEIKPKGSICVFPSFVKHRVTSVTQGIRNSLVMWNVGHPFK